MKYFSEVKFQFVEFMLEKIQLLEFYETNQLQKK